MFLTLYSCQKSEKENIKDPSPKIIKHVIKKLQELNHINDSFCINPNVTNFASGYFYDIGSEKLKLGKEYYLESISDLVGVTDDKLNLMSQNHIPSYLAETNLENDYTSKYLINFSKIYNGYLFVEIIEFCDKVDSNRDNTINLKAKKSGISSMIFKLRNNSIVETTSGGLFIFEECMYR